MKKLKHRSPWLHASKEDSYPIITYLTRQTWNVYYYTLRWIETVRRVVAWIPVIARDIDFDGASLYKIMEFKLSRLLHALKTGHLEHNKKKITALKDSIDLCKKLYKDDYSNWYYKNLDKKWGKSRWKKLKNGRYTTHIPKVKTAKNKKEYHKDLMQCFKNAEVDKRKDRRKLTSLINKHIDYWWD